MYCCGRWKISAPVGSASAGRSKEECGGGDDMLDEEEEEEEEDCVFLFLWSGWFFFCEGVEDEVRPLLGFNS